MAAAAAAQPPGNGSGAQVAAERQQAGAQQAAGPGKVSVWRWMLGQHRGLQRVGDGSQMAGGALL